MAGIICAWFNVVICIGTPAVVFLILRTKRRNYLRIFLAGACAYFISQICIRQPLFLLLQDTDIYRIFSIQEPIGIYFFHALTAALVEESARYIVFRLFEKNNSAGVSPLYYGLGHGGIEAFTVGINNVLIIVFSADYLNQAGWTVALAGIERIATLIAQIAFSFIVYKAIQSRKIVFFILAIFVHTVYDLGVVLLDYGISPAALECLLLFISILLLYLVIKFQKRSVLK